MTIGEAFETFKEDNPDCQIGKSSFASLRPKEVGLVSDMPHNVCGCKIHQNMILILSSLNKKLPNIFPAYSKNFVENCVCSVSSELCMSNSCPDCQDLQCFIENYVENISEHDMQKQLSWQQWQNSAEQFISKVTETGTIGKAVEVLQGQLSKFLWHSFVKFQQSSSYNDDRNDAIAEDSNLVLVQFDFSENASTFNQDEIQSAYFAKRQITIFTVVIWHKKQTVSWVILSDYTRHEKTAVAAFLAEILEFIKAKFPSAGNIKFWSDGPSSQFKSKYFFALLCKLQALYPNFQLEHNYFATSHGKGPCDGLGGTVKRLAQKEVLARRAEMNNAKDFCNIINISNTTIRATEMSEETIQERNVQLQTERLWSSVPSAVPGTQNIHYIKPKDSASVSS